MANSTQMTMDGIPQVQGAVGTIDSAQQPNEGLRLYHGRILDELPGAVFAAATLVWVISSFGHLIW